MQQQLSDEARREHAHFVVDNADDNNLLRQVLDLHKNWSISMFTTAKRLNFRSMVREAWQIWIAVGLGLMVLEVFVARIRLGVPWFGDLGGAVAAALNVSFEMQLVVSALTALLAFVFLRPFALKMGFSATNASLVWMRCWEENALLLKHLTPHPEWAGARWTATTGAPNFSFGRKPAVLRRAKSRLSTKSKATP